MRRTTLGLLSDQNRPQALPMGKPQAAQPTSFSRGSGRSSLGIMSAKALGMENVDPRGGLARASVAAIPQSGRNSMARFSTARSIMGSSATAAAPIKDPRPIRDKSYQYECIRGLINFLAGAGYDQALSEKMLSLPSSKDFQSIFRFIYSMLDPNHDWKNKKFEEEVPQILKAIRYPFANDISRTQLYAVGSPHAWPTLLAMLWWMVELVICVSNLTVSEDLDEFGAPGAPDPFEKTFFDHAAKAYALFLSGSDDFEKLDAELAARFEKNHELAQEEIQDIKAETERKTSELHSLLNEDSPLVLAEKERNNISAEIEQLKKDLRLGEQRKMNILLNLEGLAQDIKDKDNDLAEITALREDLKARIDAQELSPADVERMGAEREALERGLAEATELREKVARQFWEREMTAQKRIDSTDRLIQRLNDVISRLEMDNGLRLESELELLPHAPNVESMTKLSINSSIKPVLLRFRERLADKINEAQEARLAIQESLDRLADAAADKRDEISQEENKINRLQLEYQSEKEASTNESRVYNEEIEALQSELARLRSQGGTAMLQAQQDFQRKSIELEQRDLHTNEEKERAGKEILRVIEVILEMKGRVDERLVELGGMAEQLRAEQDMASRQWNETD